MYNTVPIDDEAGPFVKCGYKIHTTHNRVTLIREQFGQYESNYSDLVTGECYLSVIYASNGHILSQTNSKFGRGNTPD